MDVDREALAALEETPERCLARYRAKLRLGRDFPLTIDMVRKHWLVERGLAKRLLATAPEERAAVFEQAYSQFYQECPWLHRAESHQAYDYVARVLRGKRAVFEIGSGNGRLIRFLAAQGFACVGSEITGERGCSLLPGDDVAWHATDGIHLAAYEPEKRYDAIVSTQVIEHFHPDDVATHFRQAFIILKDGGVYFFETPQRFLGPHDVSGALGLDRPACMHLKEYTYRELHRLARAAGFSRLSAVYVPPDRIRAVLGFVIASGAYLRLCMALETILGGLPRGVARQAAKVLWVTAILRPNISMRVQK